MQNENLKSLHEPLFSNVIFNMSFDPYCTHLNLVQAWVWVLGFLFAQLFNHFKWLQIFSFLNTTHQVGPPQSNS
jgi:hypothetical protein